MNLSNWHGSKSGRKRKITRLGHFFFAATLVLTSVTSAFAYMGMEHPFSAQSIFYQDWQQGLSENNIGIDEQGIDQGAHGDCWFESAVASLSIIPAGSRLLSDMIVTDGNGWSVTFQDTPQEHHKVTRADIQRVHVRNNALWADVLEAALINRFPLLMKGKTGAQEVGHKFHTEYQQGTGQFGLSMLCGHKAEHADVASIPQEDLEHILYRNDGMHYALTASTYNTLPDATTPIPGNHVYSFLRYEPATKTVWMRNPWGTNNPTKAMPQLVTTGKTKDGIQNLGGGVLRMHIRTFRHYYQAVNWNTVFHS